MTDDVAVDKVIMYGHSFCPEVGPVKSMLVKSDVPFEYIDIRQDQTAAAHVRSINNGNESVPTLVFPDGSTLTEPGTFQLKAKLEELGYKVGWQALITGNIWRVVLWLIIIYALLRFFGVI